MINFYSFYNKTGLDNQHYDSLINQLRLGIFTSDLAPIESIIKKDSIYAYHYAKQVIRGRWFEAEPYIMKDSNSAYSYALYVIRGRWEEAEPVILTDPRGAWLYALYILKSRWIEAEPYIKEDGYWWGEYCRFFKI